jgi:uncharacterized protein YkwD
MEMNRRTFTGTALFGTAPMARLSIDPQALEESVLAAINRERNARGIPALEWSSHLAPIAQHHSEQMVRLQFFSHSDPERGNVAGRLRLARIRWRACGEVIYRHFGPSDAAEAAVAAWMESDVHRSNLLNSAYRGTAAGAAVDSRGRCLITQIFVG